MKKALSKLTVGSWVAFVEEDSLHGAYIVVGRRVIGCCEFVRELLRFFIQIVILLQSRYAMQLAFVVVSLERLLPEDLQWVTHLRSHLLR